MVMQVKIYKQLFFVLALCSMPKALFGMNLARGAGSGKKSVKVAPLIEPNAAFQLVAAAVAENRDLSDSPRAPMGDERKARIENWAEEGPCIANTSESDERRFYNRSAPVSGHETPVQGTGKMSSSSSYESQLSKLSVLEDRLWKLERVTEGEVLDMTDSIVRYHEKLNDIHYKLTVLSDLSETGVTMISKGKFAKEVDAKIDKAQKEAAESLAQKLKEKDKKIETLEAGISAFALQLTRLQSEVKRQQRPWWKRCSCFKRQDSESENVKSECSEGELSSLRTLTLYQNSKSCSENNRGENSLPHQVPE